MSFLNKTRKKSLAGVVTRAGIVGAGRVGSALARALKHGGASVVAVYDQRFEVAETLASEVGAAAVKELSDLRGTVSELFVTTPDDEIHRTAAALAAEDVKVRVVAHLSGALSSTVLGPLAKTGAALASLHPIQTFRGDPDEWKLLTRSTFAVEGDERGLAWAEELVRGLGGDVIRLKSDQKALYHATCSAASNFLVSLWHLVEHMALQAGLTPIETRRVLIPLAEQTLRNLAEAGPLLSLTGPIARGDVETVRRQVEAVNAKVATREKSLFAELAEMTADLAGDAGYLEPQTLEKIREVLRKIERDGLDVETGSAFSAYLDAGEG